jgi:hypothetical protein
LDEIPAYAKLKRFTQSNAGLSQCPKLMKFTATSTTPVMKAAIQENRTASMMTLIICRILYRQPSKGVAAAEAPLSEERVHARVPNNLL